MFHESIRYVIEAFVISLWILCGVFGACIGSFLNVVIVRLPKGESIVRPRSRCPSCGAGIAWYDNIPVLSFLLLLGKCRRCKKSISPRYLLVELLAAGLALATLAHERQVSTFLVYYCLFVAPLLTVIFIDLERRIIPNEISLSGIVIGLVIMHAFWDSLLGILVGGGFLFLVGWIYEKLKKKEGLGGGDVKLAAMFGAFFGWQAVIFILLMASVLGSIVGLVLIAVMKKNWQTILPFGPFLVLGAYLYYFFGPPILHWYLNLF